MKVRKQAWFLGFAVVAVVITVVGLATTAIIIGRQAFASGKITPRWIAGHITGVAGMDARQADFSGLHASEIALLTYDTKTQWPDKQRLPAGFDPEAILQQSIAPGLGLDSLHQQGITGKGVNVAVIDKYILPDHQELAGRIQYTKILPDATKGTDPHFHGMAVASILAGTRVGVAPGAFLYYFAVPDDARFDNYVVALAEILKLNPTLPAEKRIRIVSVSWAPTNATNRAQWGKLVEQAQAQGIAVITADGPAELSFAPAGALPGRNMDDPKAYDWAYWLRARAQGAPGIESSFMGVPASYRTTASVAGTDAYVHWGDGGQSWAIPYVAGLLALGLQVEPDATFPELYQALNQTATSGDHEIRMVSPTAYIAALRK